MVTVRIPTALRSATEGSSTAEVAPGTVDNVLKQLCEIHDSLRAHLFHSNETRKGHILVAVNGTQARDDTAVGSGDEVDLLVATAGGAEPRP
jgi:molybdopterin converting factor small subunit